LLLLLLHRQILAGRPIDIMNGRDPYPAEFAPGIRGIFRAGSGGDRERKNKKK